MLLSKQMSTIHICFLKLVSVNQSFYILPLYLCSIHVKFSGEEIQHLVPVHFNLGKVEKFWLLGGCWTVSPAPFKGCVWQRSAFGLEPQSAVMKHVH